MPSRSLILNRIARALQTPAFKPEVPLPGNVFAPIPNKELLSRFEHELHLLRGEFYRATNWSEAQNWIYQLKERHELKKIVIAPDKDAIEACKLVDSKILTGNGDCGKSFAEIDLGITSCECLIARTGSVVLTTKSGFGRALSVLPPAHLVIAWRQALVADLSDAYHLLRLRYHSKWPSMTTFITGPSRTSDIEKMLVLGAHGPKKLFVLTLDF